MTRAISKGWAAAGGRAMQAASDDQEGSAQVGEGGVLSPLELRVQVQLGQGGSSGRGATNQSRTAGSGCSAAPEQSAGSLDASVVEEAAMQHYSYGKSGAAGRCR